ncbi:hypothetical protein KY285_016001 [Solanum tuberosum]|nr:hypothetical protein KY285_016001 [Solanum tuberosum]
MVEVAAPLLVLSQFHCLDKDFRVYFFTFDFNTLGCEFVLFEYELSHLLASLFGLLADHRITRFIVLIKCVKLDL